MRVKTISTVIIDHELREIRDTLRVALGDAYEKLGEPIDDRSPIRDIEEKIQGMVQQAFEIGNHE